jgi:hypothetical protein
VDAGLIVDSSALGELRHLRVLLAVNGAVEHSVDISRIHPSVTIPGPLWDRFMSGIVDFQVVGELDAAIVNVTTIRLDGVTDPYA